MYLLFVDPSNAGRKKIKQLMCGCTPDVVRLIRRGYIAASPDCPRTAFSIRLLRFHHGVWEHCTVRLAPFVEAVNKYLDARNPLFLVPGSENVSSVSRFPCTLTLMMIQTTRR